MKLKWALIILLVFFSIGKGEYEVYCKEIGNNSLWGDYIYNITIHYDGIHSYILGGEKVKDYIFFTRNQSTIHRKNKGGYRSKKESFT